MSGVLSDFIRCGRAVRCDLCLAERREWWLGNGLGAYAAGTDACVLEAWNRLDWLKKQ
jgi:hypothetical protein